MNIHMPDLKNKDKEAITDRFKVILLLFSYNVISTEYIVYFYVILVVEHTSQEIYRRSINGNIKM